MRTALLGAVVATALTIAACSGQAPRGVIVSFPASAVGAEAEVLQRQLERFMRQHPEIQVIQRKMPDAADQRRQLYLQWLNAGASDPDILQLDVIWTPEFAAAGWILPLDLFAPKVEDFFPTTVAANRWQGRLYALPWFVDVGMLYWRTDILAHPPDSFADLSRQIAGVRKRNSLPFGFLWQGARYEGLVTVFLEHLGGFGGRILDEKSRVVVDSAPAIRALTYMRDSIYRDAVVPASVLTWQEEQTRFAFQNGQAVLMRNWPYAAALLQNHSESQVAGKFAVAAMPATPDGSPTATLGGSQLAINANSDHPQAAYAVIAYLTQPEQMLERARVVGQYPARPALYADEALATVLAVPPAQVRRIIEHAVPRPITPIYAELSDILQIHLHQTLTRQQEPAEALAAAARAIRKLFVNAGLAQEKQPQQSQVE